MRAYITAAGVTIKARKAAGKMGVAHVDRKKRAP